MINKILSYLVAITMISLAVSHFPAETAAEETNGIQKSDEVVVSNPKTPSSKMRIVFKEELSIGEEEGDENYMFGGVIAFSTDEEGNFYVADFENHRILKYDPEGRYILTIGREGQGPGEFGNLSVPRFDKDNNLYISDSRNRRISFFDREGNFLRQMSSQDRYFNPFINSKGFIVTNKWSYTQEGNVQRQKSTYGLFDDKFNLIAELDKDEFEMSMPTGRDESSIVEYMAKSWSQAAARQTVRYILSDDDFIYLGRPDKYKIKVYSPEGKLVKQIIRDYDPIPVRNKDKEYFIETLSESLSSLPILTEDMKKKAFQKIKFPKYKPAYLSFTLMENGWLAVIVDSVKDEYTLIDIFDQDGKYIANFKTPVPAEGVFAASLFFKNGKAYAVATENGYRFVKRYNFEIQEHKDTDE